MDRGFKFGMFAIAAIILISFVGFMAMVQMYEADTKENIQAMELGYVQQYDAESGRVIWVKPDGTPAEEGISQ